MRPSAVEDTTHPAHPMLDARCWIRTFAPRRERSIEFLAPIQHPASAAVVDNKGGHAAPWVHTIVVSR
jgi:hypothetical protein